MVGMQVRQEDRVDAIKRNAELVELLRRPRPASITNVWSPASTRMLGPKRATLTTGDPVPRSVTRKLRDVAFCAPIAGPRARMAKMAASVES